MFFIKPKLNRVAETLESTLAELCRKQWTSALMRASSHHELSFSDHLPGVRITQQKKRIYETNPLFRGKDHFSWNLADYVITDNKNPKNFEISSQQYHYYSFQLSIARDILKELNLRSPRYQQIIMWAKMIQQSEQTTSELTDSEAPTLKPGFLMGGNLFTNFLFGVVGLVHAPVMAVLGLAMAIPYCLSKSEYCGSPSFFLDTALYFLDSLRKSLFFLEVVHSKFTTDSFNCITQGAVERSLNSIISLSETKLKEEQFVERDNLRGSLELLTSPLNFYS